MAHAWNLLKQPDSPRYLWLEKGVFGSWKFKTANHSRVWTLAQTDLQPFRATEIVDRDSGEITELALPRELALMYGVRRFSQLSYLDASIGIGYTQGDETQNCSTNEVDTPKREICEVGAIDTWSIPMELTTQFGRHVGVGVSLHVTLTPDSVYPVANINIPLGRFN